MFLNMSLDQFRQWGYWTGVFECETEWVEEFKCIFNHNNSRCYHYKSLPRSSLADGVLITDMCLATHQPCMTHRKENLSN